MKQLLFVYLLDFFGLLLILGVTWAISGHDARLETALGGKTVDHP
jgi:hypothetical protein